MIGSDLTKNIYKTPTLVFFTLAHQNILYVSVSIHPLTLSPVHGIENLEIIYNLDDMIIHLLHSPDLILKLYVFIPFFIRVISLTTGKMVPSLDR